MTPQKGYYSLIQFCPDASRLESINIGVILFCPEMGFLDDKTSSNTRRAEKLVGRGELAREALKPGSTWAICGRIPMLKFWCTNRSVPQRLELSWNCPDADRLGSCIESARPFRRARHGPKNLRENAP